MTDFRFSGGRKTNGPLIHAFKMPPFLVFFFFFFSVSKVGLPLMGYTAVQNTDCYLSPCQHDF